MKFIIGDKIFNTENAEKVIDYKKSYKDPVFSFMKYFRDTTLYKTKKGNFFSVSKCDYEKCQAEEETIESARDIIKSLNAIDIYLKYFEKLDEA